MVLLTGQASGGGGGAAEGHLGAIMALVRDVTWRGGRNSGSVYGGSGGDGSGMSTEEASEVVTEAKRRLPAPTPTSPTGLKDLDGERADETVAWGAGGVGVGMRRAPWPWPPRGVPPSAVGAVVALAAALPPAGKLLAGVDVMMQVSDEVIAAAKAEAAVAAGVAAAAASAGRGGAKRAQTSGRGGAGGVPASVEAGMMVDEASEAAERALLLYVSEYCGRDPNLWASVTSHVRSTVGVGVGSANDTTQRLVGALLRRCGEELRGAEFVRAVPGELTLIECLNEVEQGLLREE